jgi:hypothetical protein
MNVHFCPRCGRLNLADFLYCPYCGLAVEPGPRLGETLDASFGRLEAMRDRRGSRRDRVTEEIARLKEGLEAIESDIDELIASGFRGDEPLRDRQSGPKPPV